VLVNVLDLRERPYRWGAVLAVVEAASHDAEAVDADPVEGPVDVQVDYAERDGISVREAVLWADRMEGPVTLYLYDLDAES